MPTDPLTLFVPFASMEEEVQVIRGLQLRVTALEQGGSGGLPAWFTTTDDPNTATLVAAAAQTDPLLNLQDSDATAMLRVAPGGTTQGGSVGDTILAGPGAGDASDFSLGSPWTFFDFIPSNGVDSAADLRVFTGAFTNTGDTGASAEADFFGGFSDGAGYTQGGSMYFVGGTAYPGGAPTAGGGTVRVLGGVNDAGGAGAAAGDVVIFPGLFISGAHGAIRFQTSGGAGENVVITGDSKIGLNGATPQAQGAAIADSSAVTVSAQFNTLLAYLRLRGDIAT